MYCCASQEVGGGLPARVRAGRRLLALLALVLAVLAVGVPRASADIGWCRTDPGVQVGDEVLSIFVSAPQESLAAATGPTAVVVQVPVGTRAEVLWTDPGFGFGENVTIVESNRLRVGRWGTQIIVGVTVPASTSVPILVEIAPQSAGDVTASVRGSTNRTVYLWTMV